MIIGINGYIGSGKDTVGKIIQYLDITKRYNNVTEYNWTPKQLANGDLDDLMRESVWKTKKFAEKLKQIASMLTGIPREKFEDQEFKKSYLGEEWREYRGSIQDKMGKVHHFVYSNEIEMQIAAKTGKITTAYSTLLTVREFLQRLGTDAVRFNLHENTWVNALFADYKDTGVKTWNAPYTEGRDNMDFKPTYPNWIITDTRFPNEAQAIKDRGGYVIRVDRVYEKQDFEPENVVLQQIPRHTSETSLDDWNFDYRINNNGSLEELIDKVKEALVTLNIIS